jgi:hypothetical protein
MLVIDRNKIIGRTLINFILKKEKDIYRFFIKSIFVSPVKQACPDAKLVIAEAGIGASSKITFFLSCP